MPNRHSRQVAAREPKRPVTSLLVRRLINVDVLEVMGAGAADADHGGSRLNETPNIRAWGGAAQTGEK